MVARGIDLSLGLLVMFAAWRLVPDDRVLAFLAIVGGALSAYEALFLIQLGATPGKLATSIRVAELDRSEIDTATAWTRGVMTTVGSLALMAVIMVLPVMGDSGAGFVLGTIVFAIAGGYALALLAAPLRRGPADRVAGTIVVPHEAPLLITSEEVDPDVVQPTPMTAWGPAARPAARRRARISRLDDSPLLVAGIVAVIVAWTLDEPKMAIALGCLWVVLVVADETWRIARFGGTAGHRREGLTVIDETTGEAPTLSRSLARAVVLAVFWLFPPLLLPLWIWVRFSRSGRGPHDLVAGTLVVGDRDGEAAADTTRISSSERWW